MSQMVCPGCGGRSVAPGWDYCERCGNTGWVETTTTMVLAATVTTTTTGRWSAEPERGERPGVLGQEERFVFRPGWNPFNGRRGRWI